MGGLTFFFKYAAGGPGAGKRGRGELPDKSRVVSHQKKRFFNVKVANKKGIAFQKLRFPQRDTDMTGMQECREITRVSQFVSYAPLQFQRFRGDKCATPGPHHAHTMCHSALKTQVSNHACKVGKRSPVESIKKYVRFIWHFCYYCIFIRQPSCISFHSSRHAINTHAHV